MWQETMNLRNFFNSPAVVRKLNQMNAKKRPDWRDWDHLHTHYRYKRDCFLTWDKGILHFADELKKKLNVIVMKPEFFISIVKSLGQYDNPLFLLSNH